MTANVDRGRDRDDVRGVRLLIGSLFVAAWFFAPLLLFIAFITASPFGGGPTEAERAEVDLLVRAAVALAFLAPVGAALVARRRHPLRVLALIELGLTLLAALLLLVVVALG